MQRNGQVWNHYGTALDRNSTVINTRFNPSQAPARPPCVANATAHGYRVVRSENIHWYLDQTVHKPWTAQYDFDPCGDLDAASCKYILGGAASMWGETVDVSDLMQTVLPRAGAVGERLWSAAVVNSSVLALPRVPLLPEPPWLCRRASPQLRGPRSTEWTPRLLRAVKISTPCYRWRCSIYAACTGSLVNFFSVLHTSIR